MATVTYRAPSWRCYWRLGGRGGKKQSTTWPDEALARRADELAKAHQHRISDTEVYAIIYDLPRPDLTAAPALVSPTVREWADTWLDSKTRITAGTRRTYRAQLDSKILPEIGDMRVNEVTGTDIARLLTKLGKVFQPTTVTRYYAVIHGLFAYALLERKTTGVEDNPARRTDFVRDQVSENDTGEENHVYLSRAEFALIYDQVPQRWRPLIRFLVDSGCRWSEATAVRVKDLDLAASPPTVRIVRAWKRGEEGEQWKLGPTKGRTRRTVELTAVLAADLAPLVEGRKGNELLFTAARGGRVIVSNLRSRMWLPALARAGRCAAHPPMKGRRPNPDPLAWSTCDCPGRLQQAPVFHDLRHTHVAWCIAAGMSVLVISRRLGHHSTKITEQTYGGILPEVGARAVEALDKDHRRAVREAKKVGKRGARDTDPDRDLPVVA